MPTTDSFVSSAASISTAIGTITQIHSLASVAAGVSGALAERPYKVPTVGEITTVPYYDPTIGETPE